MISEIQTDRLIIRPRTLDDIEDCMAMDRDPTVTQYVDGPWDDPELHRSFVLANMTKTAPFPFGYWTITDREASAAFLGWVMIVPTSRSLTRAEIGWRLVRRCWGQGIATEAAIKLLALVAHHRPDTEIFAVIHPENMNSIRLAKKLGMSFKREEMQGNTLEQVYAS